MIQIRTDMFETNSSSCHVFLFPRNMEICIPSVINLDDEYYTKDNMPNLIFNDCNWGEDDTTPLIQFFYKCGVKTINYIGRHKYVTEAIEKYKDQTDFDYICGLPFNEASLKKACFGTNVKIETIEDCDLSEERFDDEIEDWDYIRLS